MQDSTAMALWQVLESEGRGGRVWRALREGAGRRAGETAEAIGWEPELLAAVESGEETLSEAAAEMLVAHYRATKGSIEAAVAYVTGELIGEWVRGERGTGDLLPVYCAVLAVDTGDAELMAKAMMELAVRKGEETLRQRVGSAGAGDDDEAA